MSDVALPILSLEEITKMREAAALAAADHPYRPLLLEMALVGLSRYAIASLTMASFKRDVPGKLGGKPTVFKYAVVWSPGHNRTKTTRLSEAQWALAMSYLRWRQRDVYIKGPNLFVCKGKGDRAYWQAMKHERVRSEVRSIARDAYVGEKVEVPDLHRAMRNHLRLNGIPENVIFDIYGDERTVGK
jgi:hypothetical protein